MEKVWNQGQPSKTLPKQRKDKKNKPVHQLILNLPLQFIRKAKPQLRRDYYRCTTPGCQAKKYVDEAETETKVKRGLYLTR